MAVSNIIYGAGSNEGSDSPQRWEMFNECMCYDFTTSAFCAYDKDLGLGLSALKQCMPYIGFLFGTMVWILIINLIIWICWMMFTIIRYACHICGGGRPSQGAFKVKKRKLFRGYSRTHVWVIKILFAVLCGITASVSSSAIFTNQAVGDAIDGSVWQARQDLQKIDQAMTLGRMLFGELTQWGFTGSALNEVNSIMSTVGSYTGSVQSALSYVDIINGGGPHSTGLFGRTQIVQIILVFVIGVVGGALLLALVNFSVRGFVHNFLALILSFATFILCVVEIIHVVLKEVMHDVYYFLVGVRDRAKGAATSACGSAKTSTIAQLRQIAVNQFASDYLCGSSNPLQEACDNYFYCGKNDICHQRQLGLDVQLRDMPDGWITSYLGNATSNPSWGLFTIATCSLVNLGGCANNTIAHKLSENILGSYAAVSVILDKVENDVVPYVNCDIGFTEWNTLLLKLNKISTSSSDLLPAVSSFIFLVWILTFVMVPFSKRFTGRNHKAALSRRRKKRMEKNRLLVEKAVSEWANVDLQDVGKVVNMSMVAPLVNGEMNADALSQFTSANSRCTIIPASASASTTAVAAAAGTATTTATTDVTPGFLLLPNASPRPSTTIVAGDGEDEGEEEEDLDELISDSDDDGEGKQGAMQEWAILRNVVKKKALRLVTATNSVSPTSANGTPREEGTSGAVFVALSSPLLEDVPPPQQQHQESLNASPHVKEGDDDPSAPPNLANTMNATARSSSGGGVGMSSRGGDRSEY